MGNKTQRKGEQIKEQISSTITQPSSFGKKKSPNTKKPRKRETKREIKISLTGRTEELTHEKLIDKEWNLRTGYRG